MVWRTTQGTFESIAAVRGSAEADRVWIIVNRTVNGSTKRYIERFYPTAQAFDFDTATDFCYVDCAKKITQASSTAVSGLSHLEGLTVKVWRSGTTSENKTVASGAITLGAAGTTLFVGLPYTSTLQPMPFEFHLQDGTTQGRKFSSKDPADKPPQYAPLIAEAARQKADLIVLGETLTYYGTGKKMHECAEPVPGPSTQYFGKLAKEHHIHNRGRLGGA